ncbi:hypothetical protein ACLOJK_037201, partial [Asimina triloba]
MAGWVPGYDRTPWLTLVVIWVLGEQGAALAIRGRHLAGRAEEITGRSVEWAMPRWTVSSLAWDRWAAMEVPDGDADLGELKKKERVSTRNGCCPPWLPFGEDGAPNFGAPV